jgi:hypothetical protein
VPDLGSLGDLFSRLSLVVTTTSDVEQALAVVTAGCIETIVGAEGAAVTIANRGSFRTLAATNEMARQVGSIQHELGVGPGIDAVAATGVIRCADIRSEPRWPEFTRRAIAESTVLSLLSFRMSFEPGDQPTSMNVYASKPDIFDELAVATGVALATHGALALTAVADRARIENLERALETNRDIGVAMGILMNRQLVTKQDAFELLRAASQSTRRKLGDIALGVIDSGQLDEPG